MRNFGIMNVRADLTREIDLGVGIFAIVDADDFDWASQYAWHHKPSSLTGYARASVSIQSKPVHYYLHRLVLRARPHENVDHINRNGLDNRKQNLRFCNLSQNMCNRTSTNKTGYRGVYPIEGKFRAVVQFKHTVKYGSRRLTSAEAAVDYDSLALELHGDFATLNFPAV